MLLQGRKTVQVFSRMSAPDQVATAQHVHASIMAGPDEGLVQLGFTLTV
jgi:hypothetical protein